MDTAWAGENKQVEEVHMEKKNTAGGSRAKETVESEGETEWLLACGGEVWEKGQR